MLAELALVVAVGAAHAEIQARQDFFAHKDRLAAYSRYYSLGVVRGRALPLWIADAAVTAVVESRWGGTPEANPLMVDPTQRLVLMAYQGDMLARTVATDAGDLRFREAAVNERWYAETRLAAIASNAALARGDAISPRRAYGTVGLGCVVAWTSYHHPREPKYYLHGAARGAEMGMVGRGSPRAVIGSALVGLGVRLIWGEITR